MMMEYMESGMKLSVASCFAFMESVYMQQVKLIYMKVTF